MRRSAALLFALAVVAASCQTQQPARTPERPVRGGTLVAAISNINLVNPATTTGLSKTVSTMLVYQGLLTVGEDLKPIPELAVSFEATDDGATWRFTLQETEWHDGKPFTSEDVKFTFDKVLLEFHPRTRQVLRSKLESIETPDAQTVVFHFKEPFSAFPLLLTVTDAPILPKHIFDGTDPKTNPANEKPIGTGPFKFVSYQKDAELRLARNPEYFREGLPYLDEVVLRLIDNPATALQALERGAIDAVVDAEAGPELVALGDNPDFVVSRRNVGVSGANCSRILGFNLDKPLFADPRLRRALAGGIDRNRLLNEVQFKYGRAHTSPMHSGIDWAHAKVDYPKFDPDAADESLTSAGWVKGADGKRAAKGVGGVADGTPLRFELAISTEQTKYGDSMTEQLGALGVEMIPAKADRNLNVTRVFEKREFDAYFDISCQGADPELGLRRTIHSSAVTPIANTNGAGYRNSEVDDLMDEAAAELDQRKRGDLYLRIQRILARDMPYIWLVEEDSLSAQSKACVGMEFDSVYLAEKAYCRR